MTQEQPTPVKALMSPEPKRLMEAAEHASNVARLRTAVKIGLVVWPATFLLDVWICWRAGAGPLWAFAAPRPRVRLPRPPCGGAEKAVR